MSLIIHILFYNIVKSCDSWVGCNTIVKRSPEILTDVSFDKYNNITKKYIRTFDSYEHLKISIILRKIII